MKVKYSQKRADVSQSEISQAAAVKVKAQTIDRRRLHHGPSGNSPKLFPTPDLSGPNVSHSCWLPTVEEYKENWESLHQHLLQGN